MKTKNRNKKEKETKRETKEKEKQNEKRKKAQKTSANLHHSSCVKTLWLKSSIIRWTALPNLEKTEETHHRLST